MKTFDEIFIKKKPLGKASAKETFKESFIKAQSAMEYLMTYGWAILIIAVVLGALFELGVFNANNFAPKAPPGACQVFRPNGPGTTSFINLEGICSGELPQYVAQFNGANSIIDFPTSNLEPPVSFFMWILPSTTATGFLYRVGVLNNYAQYGLYIVSTNVIGLECPSADYNSQIQIKANTWQLVGAVINSPTSVTLYDNGYSQTISTSCTFTPGSYSQTFGYNPATGTEYFDGSLSNLQVYNTSLSANEIQALYLEGIGGAPIDLQNLVGWWPLNGNANDYSGNGNNGKIINNVNFVSNWYSGYTPP